MMTNKSNNNSNNNNSRFIENLRDVSGMWFVIMTLATIAAFLFMHWALLMLVSAVEAIVASAAMHFTAVFTLPEVLIISGVVTVMSCVLAIVRSNYRNRRPQQNCRPQQNRRPQQPPRTNSGVVDLKEHRRRKTQQPLQRFDVAK